MADSNSLVLLPPRHTAQTAQDSSTSKTQKPSGDETFEQKLQKAKKHKVQIAVKKQITETPAKGGTSKTPSAKPAAQLPTNTAGQAKPTIATAAKPPQAPADPAVKSDEDDSTDSQDSKQSPKLAEQAVVGDAAAKKIPPKAQKTVAAKANQPTAEPKLANTHSPIAPKTVKDSTPDNESDSSDSKPIVKAVGEDEADTDGGDVADAEFGTGKIVTGGAGHKNAASDSSAGDSGSDASVAAGAAMAEALSTTIETAVGGVSAKTTTQSGVSAVGDTSAVSPLALPASTSTAGAIGKTVSPTATPQAQFAEDNHPKIVSSIQGKLLPNGGTLQMRLDPPGLGDLQVTVHLKDGVMTASFETSNDEATKLLSHSLGQLKSGLEAAGVTVDKIQVEQAPKKDSSGNSDSDSKQPPQDQQQQAQQDQQRREMVQRMWKKLAGGDPLDLVA
jgi:flagellar hook-length control protein FliK